MPSCEGKLFNHLPAIYQTSEDLCELLAVFEAVLFGLDGQEEGDQRLRPPQQEFTPVAKGISTISSLFDACETPKEFLPWLAQWVALTNFDALTEWRQRRLLAEIVPLYAYRGTKNYVERLLRLFMPDNIDVSIEDQELQGFVVGSARVGIGSRLERDRPFWFKVKINVSLSNNSADGQRDFAAQWEQLIRRVIDLAKPAHTLYEMDWQFEAEEKMVKFDQDVHN